MTRYGGTRRTGSLAVGALERATGCNHDQGDDVGYDRQDIRVEQDDAHLTRQLPPPVVILGPPAAAPFSELTPAQSAGKHPPESLVVRQRLLNLCEASPLP